jgi:hypothetical protein
VSPAAAVVFCRYASYNFIVLENKQHNIMKKTLAASIILFLLTPMAAWGQAAGFPDVPQTHENYVAINYLQGEGIIKGYDDKTFKPANLVNRAEALKIILEGNKVEVPESVDTTNFTDVKTSDWFAKYVETGRTLGIINGNPDGSYAPERTVTRGEFLKILLNTNGFNSEKWAGQQLFDDVPADAWYAPYMNYGGQAGLLTKDDNNDLFPGKELTRAEVAEIYYLLTVIRNGNDSQFLLNQAEAQMAQIEIYITAQNAVAAKRASELAVDMTQQAYKNIPDNNVVLGAAKLARAYDYLVNSFIMALQDESAGATEWANQAIAKATEAWEANNDLQPICRHVKDRANEIITQVAAA